MSTIAQMLVAGVAAGTRAAGAGQHGLDSNPGEALTRSSDCFSCHAVDHKVVGPAFADIAQRYRGQHGIEAKLVQKVRSGGSGSWGDVAMTPHPSLSEADVRSMVGWILSLTPNAGSQHPRVASAKRYKYKLADGSEVELSFPLFTADHEVTADVFSGWEQFNSYCFRCHGYDASGGAYAPDLRRSLASGMTRSQFTAVAMAGKADKGMPSWAGFFTPQEIDQIYDYVKGRSVGLVPAGRPATADSSEPTATVPAAGAGTPSSR